MQRTHPHRSRNVLLIGMPGVGKSTLGRVYAFRTGREFIDFDALLEKQAGKTIREIFASEGESGFRSREQRLLHRLGHKRGAVVALGGGTLCNARNMRFARGLGLIVQLQSSAALLAQRIFAEKQKRPLFSACTNENEVLQKVQDLQAMREEYYNCSDVEINTEHSSIDCLVLQLIQLERRTHSILQNRTLPKILLSAIPKKTFSQTENSSATESSPIAETPKTLELSLAPLSEDQFAQQELGPREAWETFDDVIWKDSLVESVLKREKKEGQLHTLEDGSSDNKKKRRKKKRKGTGQDGPIPQQQQQQQQQQQSQNQGAQQSRLHNPPNGRPLQLSLEKPTLKPKQDGRPQLHHPDKPPHRSGNRSHNGE